jgi:hypothetical protein
MVAIARVTIVEIVLQWGHHQRIQIAILCLIVSLSEQGRLGAVQPII